ncbi:MAG TPA: Mu transposase C-terminal domain-containing protein [Phycisphaerae bacterium]|nr:Mu transposase C-terminal domain-containing protein [Phycisphaerae bacterium]
MTAASATARAATVPAKRRGGPRLSIVDACRARGIPVPRENFRDWSKQKTRDWTRTTLRQIRFDKFLEANPHLAPSSPDTFKAYGEHDAAWLKENGLTAKKSAMYAARKMLYETREPPRRGRPKGSGKTEWHPRAEYLCDQFLFHHHGNAADIHSTLEAFAAKEDFPAPSYGMVLERVNGTPKGAKILARKGERALDAIAPKGRRPRKSVRDWLSLDCRIQDVFVQVPTAGGGIKHARPVCSGALAPYSWQWLDLRFDRTENGELIAATVRAASLRGGVYRVYQTDKGSAYKWLTGPGGAFLEAFGARAFRALPYEGWSKPIESAWNSVKHGLDVWFRSFCGGSIPERPEALERWAKANVHKLPTIDDLNEWAPIFLETHNATPFDALGGLTANLHAELHGADRVAVDADTIDIFFCPIIGRRVVGTDGVTLDNLLYRPEPEDLATWQGKRVWIRRDGELADRIVLCQENGEPICHAYKDQLAGATREHAREARRQRERYKRACRAYIPARDDSLATETGRILRVKREYALAQEQKLRAELGIEDQRGVRIVRPDLAEAAKKLKSRERARFGKRIATGTSARAAREGDHVDGFNRLAERTEPTRQVITSVRSLDEIEAPPALDVFAQDAGEGVIDLADVG